MADLNFSIGMQFNPELNPQKLAEVLNVIIREMKSKLGALGDNIDLIDGDTIARELDIIKAKYEQVSTGANKTVSESEKLTSALKGANGQANLLGKAFQFNQIAQSISIVTSAFAPFVDEYVRFDQQIKNIGSLDFKGYEAFGDSLNALSVKIGRSASELASAAYEALSAGVEGSVEEITEFVEVAAKAGVAGMSDSKTAVDGLTSVINAYGLKVSEAGNIASTFFAGIKIGKASFQEMVSSIATYVPSASALGVSFDQTTAAIARYTSMGTPAAQVGTQMNAVFTLLAKGTAPLNKALALMGTDLDSLRNKLKLPVEAGGGLINVMREIKLAADASGTQLAALTGRVEAAKIIESLAGSQDKYNQSLKTFNDVLSEVNNNAAEQAFQVAATSIATQTDGLKATLQSAFNSIFQTLGTGATTTLSFLTQMGPSISALTGLGSLFGGMAKNVGSFAVSLITSLIPSLATTSATTGATAISFSTMWTAALGPIGLIIAGIAAVGTALYFLGDYLVETNEEKLASAKADEEMIAGQKKVNEATQDAIKSKQALIDQYEQLNSKSSLTAEEQSKLKDTIVQLNEIYPGAISSTKTFEENLNSLHQASEKDTIKLQELKKSMIELDEQAKVATIKRVELETEVSADSLKENVLEEIDDLLGLNNIKQTKVVEDYVNSIKDAANPEEAKRALLAFNTALWNNPMFEEIPPETRQALAKQAQELTDTREKELEEKSKQANEKLSKIINDIAISGVTDVSQLTKEQKIEIQASLKGTGKTEEDVAKMMDDAAKVIRDKNLGEVISEATKVNEKLKGAESLDELVESYKNAETEIQRSAIGEKIKSIAPDAVQSTGVVKNANGELITTYALLDDKIQESAQKQKELNSAKLDGSQEKYIQSIEAEGNKYKENEVKMGELQAKISEKVKMGADTSDLQQQYDVLNSKNNNYLNDIAGMAAQWKGAGLSTEEVFAKIADATGKPIDEVEKLVDSILKSKQAVEDTETAMKSMGESFSEDLERTKAEFDKNIPELAARIRALNQAKASGDKNAIKSAKQQYEEQLKTAKQANEEYQSNKKNLDQANSLFEVKKKSSVKSESEFERTSKLFKYEESKLKLTQEEFQVNQDLQIATENRKKTSLDDLIIKQKALNTVEETKKKYLEMFKISEGKDGEIKIGMKLKDTEKNDVEKQIRDFNNEITKNKTAVLTINSTLKIEKEEIQKKIKESERKNLELQVDIGLKPRIELIGALEDDLKVVASTIEEKGKKINELNELKLLGKIDTEQYELQLAKIQSEVLDSENKQFEIKKNIHSQYSTIYDEDYNILKAKHEKELEEVEKRIDNELKLREIITNTTSSIATNGITKEYEENSKELERLKEAELISQGLFNEKKEALELEHQKKLQVIQETSKGEQLFSQRKADMDKLDLERKQLAEELALEQIRAEKTGDTKKLDELNAKMSGVEGKIKEKGDVITFLASNLQGNITEIFSSITGSEEEMKEPWRKAFSVVAGALKQLATSAITTLILGQLKINAAMGGIATLLLIPAITGIVNAGVNALLNPVLSGLLSFSTGGRVDKPTLAIVGDASEARPGSNSEWILRDDQMRLIMKNVVESFIKEVNQIKEFTSTKDIKKLNEIIINQSMYELSKHKSTENVEVYNELLNNFSKVNGNFFNLIDEVYTNSKINIKEINSGIINEDIKRYIIEEYSINKQHLYNNSVISEKLSNAMSNLNEIKTIFKNESFTFENFNDYITNYNTYSKTKSEYIDNKIPTREYKEIESVVLSKYNSYINNSTLTNLNSVQLGNNNHSILPNDILTSSQFESIINKAIQTSNNNISKKFDKLIDVVNNLDFSISDESIHKSIKRISKSGKKRART